jgi:hypothetical protein
MPFSSNPAFAFLVVLVVFLSAVDCKPLDLGGGGVYQSAEANEYFARRFGNNFFANLARSVSSSGSSSRNNSDAQGRHSPIYLKL